MSKIFFFSLPVLINAAHNTYIYTIDMGFTQKPGLYINLPTSLKPRGQTSIFHCQMPHTLHVSY